MRMTVSVAALLNLQSWHVSRARSGVLQAQALPGWPADECYSFMHGQPLRLAAKKV